jgi:hypothetical protein
MKNSLAYIVVFCIVFLSESSSSLLQKQLALSSRHCDQQPSVSVAAEKRIFEAECGIIIATLSTIKRRLTCGQRYRTMMSLDTKAA